MDVRHDALARRFTLSFPEGEAELTYEHADGRRVIFTHTFVPPALRGRGVAEALAHAGLSWARLQGLTIDTTCSYIARFLERHPAYTSVHKS